ncbi:uncharacterized protein EDB91DRAFT_1195235, partial [Suillus paluster]|uniref:uncharacterized protein n=1 Tax=Suillus paluster TaxID=48578 RepID=UPI001B8833A3
MLNFAGTLHGGCLAMMIDMHVSSTHFWLGLIRICSCSTLSIYVLGASTSGRGVFGVSQSLNIVYHSPALAGDKLHIVNITLTFGSRALSTRCEVWNVTRHRLVASAVRINMVPSELNAS